MKKFGLYIIGDEILSGKRTDKHLAKVIGLLNERGLSLSFARYLGDDRDAITRELRASFDDDFVVFCTGGIGATPDDHTRQAAAAALGVPLALHPLAKQAIAERITEMAQPLTEPEVAQRMRMGEFPLDASIIPNPYNKIPGFFVGEHFFVPGFPVMAWPMLEWVLDTFYEAEFRKGAAAERAMLVFETAESSLTPLMESVEGEFPGVKVFSLPSVGDPTETGNRSRRHIELGVKGDAGAVPAAYAALKAGVVALRSEFQEDPA